MVTRVLTALAFKTIHRTSGDVTLDQTGWTDVLTALDITLPAAIGDVIMVGANGFVPGDAGNNMMDVATVVAGSPVTYFSSRTGTPGGDGLPGWFLENTFLVRLGIPAMLPLVSGDVSAGSVTLRLRYKCPGGPRVLAANTTTSFQWWAANLGLPTA